ncbi:MAG: hypothetical protein ABIK83_10905 [Candidatus Zixiibacteriota bacterium]
MHVDRRIVFVLFVGATITLLSCAPSKQIDIDASKYVDVFPTDLTVDVNHNYAFLTWKTNRGNVPIRGYNIYIASGNPVGDDSAMIAAGAVPLNPDTYPGDTDAEIEFETFDANDLEDGVEYFAAVTIVFPGDKESKPSNAIKFVCHPHGEITLNRSYSGERDGYSFARQEYVATDALDNQVYFTQIQGEDYLASPSRIDAILPSVEFFSSSITSLKDRIREPQGPGADKIRVKKGGSCLLKTSSGQYAKIIVKGFSGTGDDRRITLDYSFMPVPGRIDF